MNTQTAIPTAPPTSRSQQPARYYFTATAALLLVLTFLGFQPYYLHGLAHGGREIAPPMKAIVLAHAVAMSAWIVLFLVQPALVATGGVRLHRKLGMLGAAVAALVFLLGIATAILSASGTPAEVRIWGLEPKRFLAIPLVSIVLFAAFVSLGIAWRRKPSLHRTLMLLATLSALPAAVSRIEPLSQLYVGTPLEALFGPTLMTVILGVVLWIVRCVRTRSIDVGLGIGVAFLFAASLGMVRLASTDAWARFASHITFTPS